MKLRVDWRASVSLVGTVLKYLALTTVVPIVTGLVYGEAFVPYVLPFFVTAGLAVGLGAAMERLDPDPDLGAREGLLMVSLTWLVVSIVGIVPYVLEGLTYQNGQLVYLIESTLHHPENALFESMSGFTTTGATVMGTIDPTYHSRGLMLWRQMTQWLGGMGIVVLAVAILPELSVGGAQLMDAEAPGPGIEKLTPRITETARALWVIYAGITLIEIGLLYGLQITGFAENMTVYNAVSHGFTTMSTGGFSPEARSIEAFSAAVQWLIVPFMVAAGTSFPLFWHASRGDFDQFRTDPEFRVYAGIMGVLSAIIAGFLFVDVGLVDATTEATQMAYESVDTDFLVHTFPIAGDVEASLRHAVFQAVSLTTTTGYATMDFTTWKGPAKFVLVFAMFVGGSAGSTGGGIKVVRWLVILKSLRRELFSTVHPKAVQPVRLGGRALDERAIRGIYAFTLLYVVIFFVATMLLVADAAFVGPTDLTVIESMTAVAATLGNIGPGLGAVGPMGSYIGFTPQSKLFMVGLMWIGRLEVFPVLVLLTRAYWQS
jgi:trk system potassium uptake protein TrkH